MRRRHIVGLVALIVGCGESGLPPVAKDADTKDYTIIPAPDFCHSTDPTCVDVKGSDSYGHDTFGSEDPSDVKPDVYSLDVTPAETNDSDTNGNADDGVAPTNLPPVAKAGPPLELKVGQTYCFNFGGLADDTYKFICGSNPTWAPGHSVDGTGSYDPDGKIVEYVIRAVGSNAVFSIECSDPFFAGSCGVLSAGFLKPYSGELEVTAKDDKESETIDRVNLKID